MKEKDPAKILGGISGGRILDAATGYGNTIMQLKDSLKDFDEIIGIDTVPAGPVLEKARSVFDGKKIKYMRMDAAELDFPSGSFDTVSMGNSLHHLSKPAQALKEMFRVLKHGGTLIVNEVYRDGQTEEEMTHVLLHHWWAKIDSKLGITHNETYIRGEILKMIGGLGLSRTDDFDITDRSDPFDRERLDMIIGTFEMYHKKAEELEDREELIAEGQKLKDMIGRKGFRWAKMLLVIGKK